MALALGDDHHKKVSVRCKTLKCSFRCILHEFSINFLSSRYHYLGLLIHLLIKLEKQHFPSRYITFVDRLYDISIIKDINKREFNCRMWHIVWLILSKTLMKKTNFVHINTVSSPWSNIMDYLIDVSDILHSKPIVTFYNFTIFTT